MEQPSLRAGRLELVPLGDEHLELEVLLDSDPEVMRYLGGRARPREEVVVAHRRRMDDARRNPGLGFWVGFDDDGFVGWWILRPPYGPDQPKVDGEAELGYRLLRDRWGRGYASEGSRELLRYGFDEVGLERIFAQTLTVNLGSRATMASLGLTFARAFPSSHDEPGAEYGEVEYEIRPADWRAFVPVKRPRLVVFDLDNTLIDRDGAFRAWAEWWVEKEGLGPDALAWLLAEDEGGFKPREELFAGVKAFGVERSVEELVDEYDREHPLFTSVEPEVLEGIARLREAGWRVAVITNGGVVQQSRKLEHTGIGAAVDYACISESAGVRKPDRRIFALAAEQTGARLEGGWMVGDHPAYDILGGINAGMRTIQVGHHHEGPKADHHLDSVMAAFDVILS
ncbi:GNAT family N-acetyltransferase [Kribbella italica]|uniref:HAD superfamily hydrolase (TIGR01549 family) n=1 Tax=Kribbella italica TaxID=1540520 RepID=A0A7W9MTK8_9ACTN|nr:GNAT family N-acetyltransferase [Kribbella italica]MBB5835307.1 HAD superfamily hydrolase (TIGR01549 family) [Kribbella italica]